MNSYDDIFADQPVINSDPEPQELPFDKERWAAGKKEDREKAFALINDAAIQLTASDEALRNYLDIQSRFDRYSVGNALLIAMQMPEATKLADFDTWVKEGARIEEGSTAITILEPGKEYAKEAGGTGVFWNTKKVFDVSQTSSSRTAHRSFPPDGEKFARSVAPPLPTESFDSAGTPKRHDMPKVSLDARVMLRALIHNAPCELELSNNMAAPFNAVYNPDKKEILLRQGLDAPTIFRDLSQELALAHMDKGGYSRSSCIFTANCASYILCRRNGIPVDSFSFERKPEDFKNMQGQEVRAELSKIRDVANTITADMRQYLEAQNRSQKNKDDQVR